MKAMEFEKRYQQLNAQQKKAVDTIDGPLMVIAGPGTGKTELLSVRVANILAKTDTLPQNILCLTYTDNGAAAMRKRLVEIIGKDAYKVAIHTFHSFGSEIITQNREFFYKGALFDLADDLNKYEILRGIFDSLDYKSPLSSKMNDEYVYQKDMGYVISELKKSGLTDAELLKILESGEEDLDNAGRILLPIIPSRVLPTTRQALEKVLPDLQALADQAGTLYEVTPLIRVLYDSLAIALERAATEHPTKPLTEWKNKWFKKNDKDEFFFKSRERIEKLKAVAYVYSQYLTQMEQAGLYDYDDMIFPVVHAIEVHDDLRYNLQEKYLYIMVDEFQDTNLAQMRILHNLTDNPANEGKPNVMIVGDDDQAIFSFQGADISNILRFKELYPSAAEVVLKDNYRSASAIINASRDVITQGDERLENIFPQLNKELSAQRPGAGTVELHQAATIDGERHWIAKKVAEDIKNGVSPSQIAVLARKHSEIQSLVPYFLKAGLAISYEREESVFDQPPIIALDLLAKVVVAMSNGEHDRVNGMLPELLSHPAWGITAKELWELSTAAYDRRERWLDVMATMPRFLDIHAWLVELAALAPHTPLEPMIDRLIGRHETENVDSMKSPFYTYFFSPERLVEAPSAYIDCLEALRQIRSKLREHHTKEPQTIASFVNFIELHKRLGSSMLMKHELADSNPNAVRLMTAHRSKGQEFDHVYIFNAIDSQWGLKVKAPSGNIAYTENLQQLAKAGGSADERLRLFYVAMTRAKSYLSISYSEANDADKATLLANFLTGDTLQAQLITPINPQDIVESAELAWYEPLSHPTPDLAELLQPQLATYKLSATHLNAFLDIAHGGPQTFLLNCLLHFPSTMSPELAYGSAVHLTLQQAHTHLAANGERKPVEDVLRDFENNLIKQRLSALEYATYAQKGSEQLTDFLAQYYDTFTPTEKTELDFAHQEVRLGEAHLTGKLDLVDIDREGKTILVTDYKTGKPASSWKGDSENDKLRLHKYRQQLVFYKLLVENSRDYQGYTVNDAQLRFIAPERGGGIPTLGLSIESEEVKRLGQLIAAVWKKIMALDFPDISSYPTTLRGQQAFEQDLLDGKV